MDKDLNIFQNAEVDLKVNGGPTNIGAFLGSYDKVILKPNKKGSKNVLEQWMLSAPHTKYVIKYDFTLEDTIIEVPDDAILEIDCGSLQHGTLKGNNTVLLNTNDVDNALVDIVLQGTWKESLEEQTAKMVDKITKHKIYLTGNTLTQDMINTPDTIYVIKDDLTLTENITIPTNCVLEFDGGSISGEYTLTGTNTCINARLVKIFGTDVTLSGVYKNTDFNIEWFGASVENEDNSIYINKAIETLSFIGGGNLHFHRGIYYIKQSLYLKPNVSYYGFSGKYCSPNKLETDEKNNSSVILYNGDNKNTWAFDIKTFNGDVIPYDTLDILSYFSSTSGAEMRNVEFHSIKVVGGCFGGIRCAEAYPFIAEKLVTWNSFEVGLNINKCYDGSLTDCTIGGNSCGLYTQDVTQLQITNCYYDRWKNDEGHLSSLNLPENIIPTYAQSAQSACMILNESRGINMVGGAFESAQIGVLQKNSITSIENAYWELHNGITFAYSYSGKLSIKNDRHDDIAYLSSYSHGYYYVNDNMKNKGLYIDGAPVGFIYTNLTIEQDGYIKTANCPGCPYYEDYEIVDETVVFLKKQNKEVLSNQNIVYLSIDASGNISKGNGWSSGVGYGKNTRDVSDYRIVVDRPDLKDVTLKINYLSTIIGGHGILKGRNIVFDTSLNSINVQKPIMVSGSTLTFSKATMFRDNDEWIFFKVYGNAEGIPTLLKSVEGFGNIYTTIMNLEGDYPIKVTIDINYNISQIGVSQIIKNYDTFECPYEVTVNYKNGVVVYRNPSRPTKNVPFGYMYIENNIPIFYTGSGWVDATGATV